LDFLYISVSGNRFHSSVEQIIIAYITPGMDNCRKDEFFNFTPKESRKNYFTFPPTPHSEMLFRVGTREALNPCQKPLDLMKYLVEHFSRPGEWVLDLCAGTGLKVFQLIVLTLSKLFLL